MIRVRLCVWRCRAWFAVTVSGEGLSGEIRGYVDEIKLPIQGVSCPTEQLLVSYGSLCAVEFLH